MRAIIDRLGDVRIVGSKKRQGGKGIMKKWRGRGENVFHPSWASIKFAWEFHQYIWDENAPKNIGSALNMNKMRI